MKQRDIHGSNKSGLWKISKGDFGLKRLIQSGLIIMTLLLGGCTTDVEEGEKTKETKETSNLWPETPAFKDDFTREFMDSTEEVQEGYYRFKSKTEGYTMLFPVNARVDPVGFERNEDVYETYSFGEQVKEDNLAYYYRITYENSLIGSDVEFNLESLSEYVGYEGDYETFDYEGKTYYYATDVSKDEDVTYYSYFSYIKSNKSDKGLRYFVDSTCADNSGNCKMDSKELEKRFLIMMKSVDFFE